MSIVDRQGPGWIDGDAGPIVRPYVMTSGRTRPASGTFDLISIVVAARPLPDRELPAQPETVQILRTCHEPISVAELASHLDLPAGTVKVLLGDLLERRLIVTRDPRLNQQPVLQAVINGLRAL